METETASTSCGNCITCCDGEWEATTADREHLPASMRMFPPSSQRMFLCPECGNKRCPKATDHRLACGRSNKPGQPGSVYRAHADLPDPTGKTVDELWAMLLDERA